VKTADVILLTIGADITRFDASLTSMLKQLEMAFGEKMWNNTMIEISKFPYDQFNIDQRDKVCDKTIPIEDRIECRNEKVLCKEINLELKNHLHVEMEVPCVFIDSYSQKHESIDDDVQQMHWKEETSKLWNFSQSTEDFVFKTIDEVLEENYELNQENAELIQENADQAKKIETLEEEKTNLNTDLTNINHQIDDFYEHSSLLSIEVQVADENYAGCNRCSMNIKIYQGDEPGDEEEAFCFNDGGTKLDLDDVDNWERASQEYYTPTCKKLKQVSKIHVQHGGGGGVQVKQWRIVTTTGSFKCDDGTFYDKDESGYVSCISDNPCHPSNPCQNGGICRQNGDDAYHCECTPGYEETKNCENCELTSYWDNGDCGNCGDDKNWEWCGKDSGEPCKQTVQTDHCPSGTANLKTIKGNPSAEEGAKNYQIDGCWFTYYATYECDTSQSD